MNVSMCENGFKADTNDWLNGAIAFGRAKNHRVKGVANLQVYGNVQSWVYQQ